MSSTSVRYRAWQLVCLTVALFATRIAVADANDPPADYYSTATGTGAVLKQQLNDIIDDHTQFTYDDLRSILQVTDADPNNPGHILLVYDRVSLDVSTINPGGPIPGWDNGDSWNREHTWPLSLGVTTTARPDGSDLHHLRPATPSVNSTRNNTDFGGAFGAQPFGEVIEFSQLYWYPGDADAGMIARAEFYMAVRYDGTESGTNDLELGPFTPSGNSLGNLNRMIEWHYAAPPDSFERTRNQIIYDDYQRNRNPFIDRPEFVWSIFVDQFNDSRIVLNGVTAATDGSSARNLDLGRVYVGGAIPSAVPVTIDKLGSDGTYYSVTTAGSATSSVSGRYNAFRTGGTDSRSINVGLATNSLTSGVRTGTVTIDNLDITTGQGSGYGAADANDTINVSLAVLDHPVASFAPATEVRTATIDFGRVAIGMSEITVGATISNLLAVGAPDFAADLDLDAIQATGDTDLFQLDLLPFSGLEQGGLVAFDAMLAPSRVGQQSAEFTLLLSDENLPGEQSQQLTLSLVAEVFLAGDYNENGAVDTDDYLVWRDTLGSTTNLVADGNGSNVIDVGDYDVWRANFGATASGLGAALGVPEPTAGSLIALALVVAVLWLPINRRRFPLIIASIVILGLGAFRATAAELQAGIARVDLTPPLSMKAPLGGYGMRMNRPAEGVHDRIFAKALVLSDGTRKFALVTADLLGFAPPVKPAIVERLASHRWSAEQIMLLPSHSHTAIEMNALNPSNVFNIPQIGIHDPALYEFTLNNLVGVIQRAEQSLQPVSIGTASKQIPGWNRNRRHRGGVTDNELTVTRIDTASGKPLAMLVNFTAHPTFMSEQEMLFSGDWPGHLQRTIEAAVGQGVTAMYYNGAQGDQAPESRPDSGESRWEKSERFGTDLGLLVAELYRTIPTERDVAFNYHSQPIELPEKRWHPDFMSTGGKEYGLSEDIMEELLSKMSPDKTTCGSLRLGDLVIVGIPGEMAAGLGLQIKTEAKAITGARHSAIGGLANEWISYILTADDYTQGGGYEASVSFYGPDLGERIVQGALDGVRQLGSSPAIAELRK